MGKTVSLDHKAFMGVITCLQIPDFWCSRTGDKSELLLVGSRYNLKKNGFCSKQIFNTFVCVLREIGIWSIFGTCCKNGR